MRRRGDDDRAHEDWRSGRRLNPERRCAGDRRDRVSTETSAGSLAVSTVTNWLRPPGSDLERTVSRGGEATQRPPAAKRAQQDCRTCAHPRRTRKQRAHRQSIDVAGMNAREQRLGEIRRRFDAESAA